MLRDQPSNTVVIGLQDGDDLLRFDVLGESGKAPDVAKQARNIAAMRIKQFVFALGYDEIGHLGRQKLFEASQMVDLMRLVCHLELQALVQEIDLVRLMPGRSIENRQEDCLVQERGNDQEHISKRLDTTRVSDVKRDDQHRRRDHTKSRRNVFVVTLSVLPQRVYREKREADHQRCLQMGIQAKRRNPDVPSKKKADVTHRH